MRTKTKINITFEGILPTENHQLAERILLGRLSRALKKGEIQTLEILYKSLNDENMSFSYSCQNEATK